MIHPLLDHVRRWHHQNLSEMGGMAGANTKGEGKYVLSDAVPGGLGCRFRYV